MYNFFLAACTAASTSATTGSACYDLPIIKQIIIFFEWIIGYIYAFFDLIGIANIGLVIIVFTILVRLALLPLTYNQQKFTKLQSIMQPELRKIQDKYKGRRDQYSMQAMQTEMKAVYAKYGASQTGGCLQTFIQLPIIWALYGAIRQLPTIIPALTDPLTKIATILNNSGKDFSSISANLGDSSVDLKLQLTELYTLTIKKWDAVIGLLNSSDASSVTDLHNQMVHANSFLGFDISQAPWDLMLAGGIGILALLLPIISGGTQFLSFKLNQTAQVAANDQMGRTMNSMAFIMPLVSIWFTLRISASIGLYWAASSLIQVVIQILINKHFRKIGGAEAIMEQAKKKAEKKKAKSGVVTGKEGKKIEYSESLAAKAGLVQKYNEEHSETVEEVNVRRKYKK